MSQCLPRQAWPVQTCQDQNKNLLAVQGRIASIAVLNVTPLRLTQRMELSSAPAHLYPAGSRTTSSHMVLLRQSTLFLWLYHISNREGANMLKQHPCTAACPDASAWIKLHWKMSQAGACLVSAGGMERTRSAALWALDTCLPGCTTAASAPGPPWPASSAPGTATYANTTHSPHHEHPGKHTRPDEGRANLVRS